MMSARNKRIGEECVAKGIPFVLIPATDKHIVAMLEQYIDDIDTDDDVENDYVQATTSDLARIQRWQQDHPEDVGPPFLIEGEN